MLSGEIFTQHAKCLIFKADRVVALCSVLRIFCIAGIKIIKSISEDILRKCYNHRTQSSQGT